MIVQLLDLDIVHLFVLDAGRVFECNSYPSQ